MPRFLFLFKETGRFGTFYLIRHERRTYIYILKYRIHNYLLKEYVHVFYSTE